MLHLDNPRWRRTGSSEEYAIQWDLVMDGETLDVDVTEYRRMDSVELAVGSPYEKSGIDLIELIVSALMEKWEYKFFQALMQELDGESAEGGRYDIVGGGWYEEDGFVTVEVGWQIRPGFVRGEGLKVRTVRVWQSDDWLTELKNHPEEFEPLPSDIAYALTHTRLSQLPHIEAMAKIEAAIRRIE